MLWGGEVKKSLRMRGEILYSRYIKDGLHRRRFVANLDT